jgi:TRAP-type C4-dicarboxylate transport system permease large subunit
VRTVLPFLLILAVSVLLITYLPALSVGVLEALGRS